MRRNGAVDANQGEEAFKACRKCFLASKVNDHTRCHSCALLGGGIMPGCMGGAVYGDLMHCTCKDERMDLESRVLALEGKVKSLNGLIRDLVAKGKV